MGNLGEELNNNEYIEPTLENMRELLGAIFIQSQRNYDMLALIAEKQGCDVDGLLSKHQEGQVLAPPPSFIFEDDDIA